ncbi:MAG: SusD/RagB family nutrient-binding outer membrane lipoprotein [Bacteroidales bacterium]|nr:SusD/RagB family nutrient-binding outer membrane lipoprotein [Bacteroidales bacterium]
MKKYKIYSLLFILLISISCTDQLRKEQLEMAEGVSRMTTPAYLLSGSIVRIANFYQERGINDDKFNAIMLYYQQLFSVKSQSHEEFAKAPDNWGTEYKLLYDTKAGIDVAEEEGLVSIAAAQKILQCLMFEYLSDIYGDIPYTEALKGREGEIQPKFDMQEDIYTGLFETLDEAVAILGSSLDEIEGDLLYNGDKQSWIRFANSLKLRMLVRSYDAFGGSKQSELQAAAKALLIDNNSFNTALAYEGTSANNSWFWGPARNGGEEMSRRKPSEPFLDLLKANNDPRLKAWIAPALKPWGAKDSTYTLTDNHGYSYDIMMLDSTDQVYGDFPFGETYIGAPLTVAQLEYIYGEGPGSGSYDNYKLSSYANIFAEDSHDLVKATLFEASEVSFCLAEAAQRGWITSGNASNYYEDGIRQNMERWDIANGDISTYVAANPLPAGNTEALTAILTEKWKSLFTQGHQSWFEYRRTGIPAVVGDDPEYVALPFPSRWRYPTYEVDNNTENVDEAVTRLGEDTQTAKIWIIKGVTPVQ